MPDKNTQIKNTMAETKQRRSQMICRVYEVKIVNGKISKEKKQHLNSLFREAKWLRNSELAKDDISLLDRNAKTATVKVGDTFEQRSLVCLGSQMRQDVVDQLKSDIRGLSELKKKGYKVGKLKFKSFCNSVPLRQYGTTYRINFEKRVVFIQGYRKPFKVRGLEQIHEVDEIANAKLVRKPSGYYFHITTFSVPKEESKTGACCGVDFGIKTNLTLSNGVSYDVGVPESKSIKLSSRRLNKSSKRNGGVKSKRHLKRSVTLGRAYEKQNNIKKDIANKIVHEILKSNDFIAIQDEMIANWHKGLFGKQVQHSAMGFIKAKLKASSKTHVVERNYPSTQKCPICGKNTKHGLSERSYKCMYCGYTHPSRDVKAAEMILMEAINNVSSERRTKSPVELATADKGSLFVKLLAVKREAQQL